MPPRAPSWYWTDNGFDSAAAMRRAHEPIVDLAASVLDGRGGRVLDLGCGNGALLARLQRRDRLVRPVGVDRESLRVEHARHLFSDGRAVFRCGDLLDVRCWAGEGPFELVLFMPGRLLGESPAVVAAFLAALRCTTTRLLIYAYRDWLSGHGGLAGLAREAGLSLVAGVGSRSAGLALIP